MEFYLTPGCEIKIVPKPSVMAAVRMEQTLTQFYSSGGTTAFSDRIASALGIHASRVKVVAVYEGSVVVDYSIESEENASETEQLAQVTQLTTTLTTLFTSGTAASVLGVPILSADLGSSSSSSVVLVAATDTSTASASATAASVATDTSN